MRRRYGKQDALEVRLVEEAKELRERAKLLPAGEEREAVLHRVRQNEAAAHMAGWLRSSPGPRSSV